MLLDGSAHSRGPDSGALAFAGWMRRQIRLYPSVRAALGTVGDPRTVLLQRLGGDVLEAFHAGGSTLDEWVKYVQRLVDQTRRTQPKRGLNHAPEFVLESHHAHREHKATCPQ